jgi:uncharacterized protein
MAQPSGLRHFCLNTRAREPQRTPKVHEGEDNFARNIMVAEFVGNRRMRRGRRFRFLLVVVVLYFVGCTVGGIYLADGSLHPGRRALTPEDITRQSMMDSVHADLRDVDVAAADQVILRGWLLRPARPNGDAALVLHGLGDNRIGMTGYSQLLLAHGYAVLLPDSRAHGVSGGSLATFGLLEQDDIHRWVDFLSAEVHPECVYGMGESMGAALLLQSLQRESRFCAVVAESPFSNFREIAYDRMGQPFHLGPWVGRTVLRPLVEVAFLRARWKYGLRMGEISPEDAVAKSHVPVLLIHGQMDGNIPVRHSRGIHELAPRTVLWEVPGADHCGAIRMDPQEFERRVIEWFGRSAVSRNQHSLNRQSSFCFQPSRVPLLAKSARSGAPLFFLVPHGFVSPVFLITL